MAKKKTRTSYSFWRAFKSCRVKWQWTYKRGLRTKETPPNLVLGRAVHQALELFYSWVMATGRCDELTMKAPDIILEKVLPDFDDAVDLEDPSNVRRRCVLEAIVRAYPLWEQSCGLKLAPHLIENWFERPIVNPATGAKSTRFELVGKVDMIAQDDEGKYWFVEHKTCQGVEDQDIEKFWSDAQTAIYVSAYQDIFRENMGGVIYNLIRKPRLRLKKNETPEELTERMRLDLIESRSFRQVAIPVDDLDIEYAQEELWALTRALMSAERNHEWYRTESSCHLYNQPCDFLPLCKTGGDEDLIDELYVQKR